MTSEQYTPEDFEFTPAASAEADGLVPSEDVFDEIDTYAESDQEIDTDYAEGNAELREAVKRSRREQIFLKTQLVESAVTRLGLDPTVGLGRAAVKQFPYKTDLDPTVDNVANWLHVSYNWTVPSGA